ncbi:hypothetical protein PLESTM_001342900 [Pleodorina starrii]|nr:hypothetical protein PLESTM_001342900 [Pleodorina starrii]
MELPDKSSSGGTATERCPRTCLACGAVEAPGKKLLRCSGCLSVHFCNAVCQKAVWKEHKAQCSRCKKVDVYAASPLLAAMAFLPRMQLAVKTLTYEVSRRELRGRELHLYLQKQGRMRFSPQEFDVSGRIRDGPSREQLHNMVQHDGYLEATVVGSLYGFHCAVQQYNSRRTAGPPESHEYVTLVHRMAKITEYGIAIGSTCPDYTLVYHIGDKVRQLQDPNNHVWMYFRTERSDRLLVDVGSLSYGMGLMLNIVDYLPEGTPESQIRQLTPVLGAPGNVLDRSDLALMERTMARERPGAGVTLHSEGGYLADRERIPLSGLPVDPDSETAIAGLLGQISAAATAAGTAAAAAESTQALVGMVAAAAVVTAAAVVVPPGSGGGGDGGGGSPSRSRSGGAAGGSSGDGGGGGGGGGGSAGRHIPFLHGPLKKHVDRAMMHCEAAFRNTYAVLEQK